ncbi:amidohydrolase family protein [Thioalkalivibrio sp. AKL8]|uniref:metal-dependent hydrolase family protein n=1 Tax=Thioalkalivibrio sp. AKL8 TaxID=1158156 RepID=UPI00047565DD|nr:amidohydrolase family protein [Thioalkalivibrio sp. AKL8]
MHEPVHSHPCCGTEHPGGMSCLCGRPETMRAMQRIEADISRRRMLGGMAALVGMFAGFRVAAGPDERPGLPDRPLLLVNLRLFDGQSLHLREGVAVLIQGERIVDLITPDAAPEGVLRVDCGGRVVMPGLIDAHWHTTLAGVDMRTALTADPAYIHLQAAREARATLMRGFTTVRDVGGPAFALKRAIDEGVTPGPRIFPSGAMISQTSGHGDFRMRHEVPRTALSGPTQTELSGVSVIADGADEVLRRAREQLMLGASQIKLMAGGGVASLYDPLDSVQYTERELRAGVEAARDWGTYATVHVYVPAGIKRAIRAGVGCIEHGQLADEEAVRMMAGEGVWWSLQPFLQDEDSNVYRDPEQVAKQTRVARGTEQAYAWAREHEVQTAWGTDILFAPDKTHTQGRQLAKMTRFCEPLEVLRMATGDNGRCLALSGPRAPYGSGLGVVQPGGLADLLVVDGEPERDLSFLAEPENSLRLIMKGGRMYRNTL